MVELDGTRLEGLIGGKGDEVSDKGAVEDISMVSMNAVMATHLSFLNCQASTLKPTMLLETRMMSAFGLS